MFSQKSKLIDKIVLIFLERESLFNLKIQKVKLEFYIKENPLIDIVYSNLSNSINLLKQCPRRIYMCITACVFARVR